MKEFIISGQIISSRPFDHIIAAENEDEARAIALRRVESATANLSEFLIETVVEVLDD
jgi:hypothetical protein